MNNTSACGLPQRDTVALVPRHWQKPLIGGVVGPTCFYDTRIHETQPHHEEARQTFIGRAYVPKQRNRTSDLLGTTNQRRYRTLAIRHRRRHCSRIVVAGDVVAGAWWRSAVATLCCAEEGRMQISRGAKVGGGGGGGGGGAGGGGGGWRHAAMRVGVRAATASVDMVAVAAAAAGGSGWGLGQGSVGGADVSGALLTLTR